MKGTEREDPEARRRGKLQGVIAAAGLLHHENDAGGNEATLRSELLGEDFTHHLWPQLFIAGYLQFELVAPYRTARDGADAAAPLVGQNPLGVRVELECIGGKPVASQVKADDTKSHVGSECEFGAGLRSWHDVAFRSILATLSGGFCHMFFVKVKKLFVVAYLTYTKTIRIEIGYSAGWCGWHYNSSRRINGRKSIIGTKITRGAYLIACPRIGKKDLQ